jgi:beta-barrel assembly-enhancing protease
MNRDRFNCFALMLLVLAGLTGLFLPGCEAVTQVAQEAGKVAQEAGLVTKGEAGEVTQKAGLMTKDGAGKAAQEAGLVSQDEADSIKQSAAALRKSRQQLTPEQEYYIGRSVAAQLFQTYSPLDQPTANTYLNVLGQSLALFSDRPETFDGYHFLLLDTDEINAFAAPGGLILLTRGMLSCCASEDELAAVLAHEICHVELRHGVKAIKQGRLTEAIGVLATESAKQTGDEELMALTRAFEGSVGDVVKTLTASGYSREQERDADFAAVQLLRRADYPEAAMINMLNRMDERLGRSSGPGFAKTHPSASSRSKTLRANGVATDLVSNAARQKRFTQAVKLVEMTP